MKVQADAWRWPYLATLLLIVVFGAYLRLVDLGGPSLWHDEIVHLKVAERVDSIAWHKKLFGVREAQGRTENGPLYYWLQVRGLRLAGNDAGARLFPAFFGVLTLPLMAFAGKLVGGRLLALVATFLLAVSPLHVYFSREGRPYSLIILLTLVLLLVLLARSSRWMVATTYGACLIAAYLAVQSAPILLSFAVLSLVGVGWDGWRGRPPLRSPYCQYLVAAALALGLAYALYLTRSSTNQPSFVPIPSPVWISPLSLQALERFAVSMSTSGHQSGPFVLRTWIFLALAAVGAVAGLRNRSREIVATIGMFILPVGFSIFALIAVGKRYGLRYTSWALPAFLLLVGVGIVALGELAGRLISGRNGTRRRQMITGIAAGALVLAVAAPNLQAARSDPYKKLDWRGIAQFFERIAIDGESIVIGNRWPQICLGHYLEGSSFDHPFIDVQESVADAEAVVASRPHGWLLTAGFRETGEVRAWMHRFHPVLKNRREEMALFFYPDFVTLLGTRFAAGKGTIFQRQFAALGERFDFAGAEMMLQGAGWSYHEQNQEGITYQWAMGEQAELGVPAAELRDRVIRFRALPFTYPDAPSQTLELWLNESLLTSVELPRGWSEHEIEVPASVWGAGPDILFLRFGRSTVPAEVIAGSQDRRRLSAAFDFLELRNLD